MPEIKTTKTKNQLTPQTNRAPGRSKDPLYTIFERHLDHFQDANVDRQTFIAQVVGDYLTYLRKLKLSIPRAMEGPIVEELGLMVNTMLVKKIYGFHSIDEYQKRRPRRRQAKRR